MSRTFLAKPRRPRSTRGERAGWVERFEQSGVSQEAFARRHQIGLSTLSKWVKEARTGSVPSEPVSLREVNFGQMLGSPAWVAELSRKDGTVVRLTANVRGDMIERLLRA